MKNIRAALAAAIAAALLLPAAGQAKISDADRAAIKKVSEQFTKALLARDMDGLAALYTEDAVLVPPGSEPIRGRAAIKAHFATFPKATAATTDDLEMGGGGDGTVWILGRYSATIVAGEDGETAHIGGSYMDIRKKQPDGKWLIFRDVYTEGPAAE